MKVLAIYPNADGYGRIPTGLAIIMTCLKNAGHELALFDTTFMHDNLDNATRERANLVKKIESFIVPDSMSPSLTYEPLSDADIDDRMLEKLKQFEPDVVILSLVEDNYKLANRLLKVVKKFRLSIPVVVGGPTPSAAPHIIIENPNIDYLIQGEGEEAIVEFFDLFQRGLRIENVMNLWYKKDGRTLHNPLRPFINIDDVPCQDVDLWDRRHFYKPYDGKMYWTGYFEMSRGCPFRCTYCVNHAIRKSIKDAGNYFRRKTPLIGLQEIKHHKEKFDLRRIVFCDDNFLMMPERVFKKWADEFKSVWMKEINLPYWITTSCEFIRPETLQFLKDTGCDGIGLGVEAGGEWFRRNILKRNLSDKQLIESFSLIHDYGIRTTANIMMGFPGEREEDIFESIKLMMAIKPKSYDVSLVAPYVGTEIQVVSSKLGLIDTLEEPGFKGMARKVSFRQQSSIRNPNISPERILELYNTFTDYVAGKLQIPGKYMAPSPGAGNNAPHRGDLSGDVAEVMRTLTN